MAEAEAFRLRDPGTGLEIGPLKLGQVLAQLAWPHQKASIWRDDEGVQWKGQGPLEHTPPLPEDQSQL